VPCCGKDEGGDRRSPKRRQIEPAQRPGRPRVAIVTEIAGTTRDVLREHIHLDGMPLHIIDTAGLRDTQDKVEQIGIERAWAEIEQADRVLFMVDGTTTDAVDPHEIWPEFVDRLPKTSASPWCATRRT
jgi:tRNA modification GTPase